MEHSSHIYCKLSTLFLPAGQTGEFLFQKPWMHFNRLFRPCQVKTEIFSEYSKKAGQKNTPHHPKNIYQRRYSSNFTHNRPRKPQRMLRKKIPEHPICAVLKKNKKKPFLIHLRIIHDIIVRFRFNRRLNLFLTGFRVQGFSFKAKMSLIRLSIDIIIDGSARSWSLFGMSGRVQPVVHAHIFRAGADSSNGTHYRRN